jgi:hypothetical protein
MARFGVLSTIQLPLSETSLDLFAENIAASFVIDFINVWRCCSYFLVETFLFSLNSFVFL